MEHCTSVEISNLNLLVKEVGNVSPCSEVFAPQSGLIRKFLEKFSRKMSKGEFSVLACFHTSLGDDDVGKSATRLTISWVIRITILNFVWVFRWWQKMKNKSGWKEVEGGVFSILAHHAGRTNFQFRPTKITSDFEPTLIKTISEEVNILSILFWWLSNRPLF